MTTTPDTTTAAPRAIELESLRPTQMTVGMALVKAKRKSLRGLEGRPQELVDFIVANPVRIVNGPKARNYVIDHHHFALAMLRENFKSAPLMVVADLSTLSGDAFWKAMQARQFVYPVDDKGKTHPISDIPRDLEEMEDDPYRSLAGFVREHGGFTKTFAPFVEFQWADYFRPLVPLKLVSRDMPAAVKDALKLAHLPAASKLPGFVAK